MSFLFDKLFQKQNPDLAGQMAQRGLIFDRNKHRWVKQPKRHQFDADGPTASHSEIEGPKIPGMEGPFNYKTGNTYYYSPKEGQYYDAKSDVFMPRGFDPHTGQYVQEEKDSPKKESKRNLDSFYQAINIQDYIDGTEINRERAFAIEEAERSGSKYKGLSAKQIATRWSKIKKNLNKWDRPKAGKEHMAHSNWIWDESPKPRSLSQKETLTLASLHKEFWTGKSDWEGMDLGLPGVTEELREAEWKKRKGYGDEEVYNPDESGEDWLKKIKGATSANFQRRLMHSSLLSRKIGDPMLASDFERLQAESIAKPFGGRETLDAEIRRLEDQLIPKVKERLRGWKGYDGFYDEYSGHPLRESGY